MADKIERQEIDPFPGLDDFIAQRTWFAARLEGRSDEECILLASRAALRTLPMLRYKLPQNNFRQKARKTLAKVILPLFGCHVSSVIFSIAPAKASKRFQSAVYRALSNAYSVEFTDAADRSAVYFSAGKLQSADEAVEATTLATRSAAARFAIFQPVTRSAPFNAADALAFVTSAGSAQLAATAHSTDVGKFPSYFIDAFSFDHDLLETQPLHVVAARPLWSRIGLENPPWVDQFRRGTWPQFNPPLFLKEWDEFSKILREAGDDWDIWVEWFDGVYQGVQDKVYLFGLSTERALKLWQDVALIDDDTWRAGPAVLNAEFKRLVAVAKKEVADSRLTPTSAAKLETLGTNKPRGTKGTVSKTFAPKTATGKAIFANAGSLALHTYSLVSILDSEVERIKESRPNSDDAINERDQLINKFKDIRSDVLGFQATLIAFAASEVPEKEVITKADSVLKPFRDCWNEKGKEFIEVASRSGLFLGAMAIAQYCGVPPLAGTLVFGAISSGKPLVEVLKAAKGIFKLT